MRKFFLLLALFLASGWISSAGTLSVKEPYSDGMVLQQNTMARLCGHADAGSEVKIVTSWNKAGYTAKADDNGIWCTYVGTPKASYTPYSVQISSGREKLTISDVLIGEVWLATGQSNMEMPIKGFPNCPVEGSLDVILNPAGENQVRMFTVGMTGTLEPVLDVVKTDGWKKSSPETVARMSAAAYFFAEQLNSFLDVPVGIVALPRGGTRVESWLPREMIDAYGTESTDPKAIEQMTNWLRPYIYYNAMFCPVCGYTAKGFIWYQGCSNVDSWTTYADRLKDMVDLWRSRWGDNEAKMPFYQVEIAPYEYGGENAQSPWLRDAQRRAAKMIPNCAIVGTDDLVSPYEQTNIHPCRKKPVGQRLALLALNRDYGHTELTCYGPEAVGAVRSESDSSVIYVKVVNCFGGIDRQSEVEGLEVAGADGVFVPVTSLFYDESRRALKIQCQDVPCPVQVRYCWRDYSHGNVHNGFGLPLFPFNLGF